MDKNAQNFNDRPIGNLMLNSARVINNEDVTFTNSTALIESSTNAINHAFFNYADIVNNRNIKFGNKQTNNTDKINYHKPLECYSLGNKTSLEPRGLVLVLANETFQDPRLNRPGSAIDVAAIRATFGAQNFDVFLHANKSMVQTWDILLKASQNVEYSKYSCFILIILSHGKENGYFCADEEVIEYQKLFDLFHHCQFMVGKPKIYFIQACLGSSVDNGTVLDSDAPVLESDARMYESKKPNSSIIPKTADTLVFYCSYIGYVSYRDKESGSWFIQDLCSMINKFADTEELLDILRRVGETVSKREGKDQYYKVYKQIPYLQTNMFKKFYFNK